MGAGAWQLDMSAVLAPEYAHAITSFRFIKKVPLLGRFEDAAAMCLFYFLLMRVPTPATSPARVFAWLPAGVCSREPRNLARTRSRHARARTRATWRGREQQKRDSRLGCDSRARMEGRGQCV